MIDSLKDMVLGGMFFHADCHHDACAMVDEPLAALKICG